ncbi:DUF5004 domain-containing protein [Pedobacter sandarakinus]|uniref:DUF5004 domain-containing protein n=1 Tax=Pedobacter sandarakinus TaxID=353156 RepID=UPI002247457A|nr:DUF5004 domain-containing protein [Pedobacter sandarakinus]MCX2574122.1 DUF5004 domain-containing protein [Pedobacter sandarakinus]
MRSRLNILAVIFLTATALLSCKKVVQNNALESTKELNGPWQIIKITQNGEDLTPFLDLTKYKITFNGSKYAATNELPFLAKKNGEWSFSDPNYPFAITFKQDGGTAVSTSISYPIVGATRQMIMSFDLGCNRNVYTYTLQPAN